jgi:hypothetical protein
MRIVFVGAPGSGKSTLAAAVFTALKQSGRSAELVDEFIRRDIALHGPMKSIWEQYRTRQHQQELEDCVPAVIDYVICDSGTISPYFYSCLYVDPTDSRQRIVLQDMHRYLINDLYMHRYDLIFYLSRLSLTNFCDGTRYQTMREVDDLDQHMELLFTRIHKVPGVFRIDAPYEKRLEAVMWKILGVAEPELSQSEYANIVLSMCGEAGCRQSFV